MGKPVIADSVAYLPEMAAWYNTIVAELAQIDMKKLLVYMIDSVDASALPYLGSQFDVLGYKGFRLANTEADQREIIKRAIELHRYKGTEWAIKEALKSIGFADVVLLKGPAHYDHWAKFGIELTSESVQLTAESFNDITNMIKEYKRAVCVLMEIRMTIQVADNLFISEDLGIANVQAMAIDTLTISGALRYDGSAEFDGSHNFSGDGDVATAT